MLPLSEWLDAAQLLQEGQKRRVNHTCGPGRTMLIAHTSDGYSAYCFRCPDSSSFKPHGLRTLDQLHAAREAKRYAYTQDGQAQIRLPADFTTDIPKQGRMWYYRAGIPDSIARLYGFGWSDAQQRVVIPVRCPDSGDLVFVQSRAVRSGQQPKYLNCAAAGRSGIMFTSDPRTLGYYDREGSRLPEDQGVSGTRIVLGEDILSAIRIGMSTQAGAILGTKLDPALASKLKAYQRVTFWLDGDKAGRRGRLQGLRTLQLVHTGQVDYIESECDPKSYNQKTIEGFLNDYCK